MILVPLLLALQTPDTLTLEQALARARERRPQTQVASALVERAEGAKRVGSTMPNPGVQFEKDDLAPARKLTVSQPLSWLPRYRADLAAGRAGVQRAVADSTQVMADIARDVRVAFFAALAAEERLRLVGAQAVIADSLVVLAARRVTAGDISALERDQIAQDAARARLTVSQAREQARIALLDLARATAWDGGEPPRPAGRLDDGLEVVLTAKAAAEDVEGTPRLRGAIADSAAAAARLRALRIAQLPIPALLIGQEWNASVRDRQNLLLGFSMQLPVWNHGGGTAAEARAIARDQAARVAETRLENTMLLAAAQVHLTETADRAREARDVLMPASVRLRAGAIRLYEAGRTGMLPVFDALRSEREIAQTMVQELLAFQQARADLNAMLGRWQ